MAKRRAEERGGGRAVNPKRQQRRHLYLLFDDWASGYSIRKVNLPSDVFGSDEPPPGWQMAARVSGGWEMVCTGDQRLPPAIFRLEAQRGLPMYFAAAFDSKILAMQPIAPGAALPSPLEHHVPIFDVRARSCRFAPRSEPDPADPIYIPAAGRLLALAAGTFDLLDPPPPLDTPADGEEATSWLWMESPDPPFEHKHVTSYAVHPDGGTIFISTAKSASPATFSIETEDRSWSHGWEWKRHGEWALPFAGRAYYDRDLDAWVGLSGDPESIGYLCSCDVLPVNPDAGGDGQPPAQKISKERLFSDHWTESHVGATLVYMGAGSEFCLVQCVSIEDSCADDSCDSDLEDEYDSADDCDLEEEDDCDDDLLDDDFDMEEGDGSVDERKDCDLKEQDGSAAERDGCKEEEQDLISRPRRHLLRLTTFTLKYDRNGDLTTGRSRQVRYYRVPKESTVALLSNPVAFWM